jgi:flagellar basal-body rod protein FlgC
MKTSRPFVDVSESNARTRQGERVVVDAIGIAASGLAAANAWMNATAANIANEITPGYRAEVPVFAANSSNTGVAVASIGHSTDPRNVAFDPGNPSADRHGLVTLSNVDLSVEIPNLMMASAYYQANLAVMQRAQDTYKSIIGLQP